ncbi:MAG: hypothetical protein RBQ71_03240 [Acholeplasmataceae bacterium]|jgi:DNA-binding helix-hairpin-helix protein with protein kinase domain|nr:hypothetical protein [Acholeplasmataceae bacterium]
MKKYFLEDGSKILIDDSKPIGSGGEGSVFKLAKNPNILVKIYSERALERMPDIEVKIKAMVKKKPGLLDYNGLTIIAWPSYVVYDEYQRFQGYLMRRVQAKNQLSHVITPGLQKAKFPHITYYDRVVIAINLAKVMGFLHQNDTIIGDINTSDFFVYPGFEIGVVDTDSFQFQSDQKLFHCKVFTPDYTAPEVIEAKKKSAYEVKRLPNHDNYGLAILIYQILMFGVHPFSARIKGVLGFDGNAINYTMEKEIFPYNYPSVNIIPPKNAMPYVFLPKNLQELFNRAFAKHALSNHDRPSTEEWVKELKVLKDSLKKCKKDKTHFYPSHFQKCPICAREQTKDYDYLVDYFKSISKKYITYDTDKKPIVVDENNVYNESILGVMYTLKKGKQKAYFFDPKMMDKYKLNERIEKLYHEGCPSSLKPYFSYPTSLIKKGDLTIGYTTKHLPKVYRVVSLLKGNRVGNLKITEKAKIIMAKHIAKLFVELEKHHIALELSELFVDQQLKPYLPDIALLGTKDKAFPPMAFQREEYLPQEYYAMLSYQEHLKKLEEEKAKIEKEKKRLIEEARQRDLELIRSPLEPKVKKIEPKVEKEIEFKNETPTVTFEFEKSHAPIETDDIISEVIEEDPKDVTYDLSSKETIKFHLAVIIHTILHDIHPFKATHRLSSKPISYFVEKNIFIHKKTLSGVEIDEKGKPIEIFPNYYQKQMKKALIIKDIEKIKRPSSRSWQYTLFKLQHGLTKCRVSEYHDYPRHLISCPYCYKQDKHDHEQLRQFTKEHKRGFTFNYLFINRLFNYLFLAAGLVGLIYLVNTNPLTSITDFLSLIKFSEKLELIKEFIHADDILRFLNRALDWLLNIYRSIFGGMSS